MQQKIEKYGLNFPHDLEMENCVIGAILINNTILHDVMLVMEPDHFYNEKNKEVFISIKQLYNQKKSVDLLTLTNQLRENKKLEFVGGSFAIVEYTQRVATTENIDTHIEIVLQNYIRRQAIMNATNLIKQCYDNIPASEIVQEIDNMRLDAMNLMSKNKGSRPITDILNDAMKEFNQRQEATARGIKIGLQTGYADIDRVLGYLRPGQLIGIGARPGHGKTSLALAIGNNIATTGKNVLINALEMSDVELVDKIIIGETGIESDKYKNGKCDESDIEKLSLAYNDLIAKTLFIDDKGAVSLSYIRTQAKIKKLQCELDLLIVDYLGLMKGESKYNNKVIEISEITGGLKSLAKELNIPVIVVFQLSRKVEDRFDKVPNASDARDSGGIEQDCDVVMLLMRPKLYNLDYEKLKDMLGFEPNLNDNYNTEDLTLVNIAKQRNGRTGIVFLRNNESCTKYYDI